MRHNELLETLQNLTNAKPKQREIAEALGVDVGVIGKRASRNSEYSLEELQKINEFYGKRFYEFDLFAGLYGHNAAKNVLKKMTVNTENEILLDYYPEVFGSCGNGTFVLSECREPITVPRKCFTSFVSGKQYSVINAYGDSMMPYIHDKDKLIVEHWSGEQIRDNRVYVFRFGDNIFVKRLVQNINQIVVKSDNTIYDTMKIEAKDAGDLQIIGRIVGLMRDMD